MKRLFWGFQEQGGRPWRGWLQALCCAWAAWIGVGSAWAADGPVHLRIVGALANVAQYTEVEEPFWMQEMPRISQGRIVAEIVPFDRAGIRAGEMLRLMQVGAVPFGSMILSRQNDPVLNGADLTGLNPDYASLKRNFQAYRPILEKTLREKHGVEPLAFYIYPAQVLFCNKKFSGLSDLQNRRIRVSDPTQADLIKALGASPVLTEFIEIVPGITNGNLDCAVTGGMSGNSIGLHEVTTHFSARAITWGMVLFAANAQAWKSLPQHARQTISQEMPRVEAKAWSLAERLVAQGAACNTGASTCVKGKRGRMTQVADVESDATLMRDMFRQVVLSRWIERCGSACERAWAERLEPVTGIRALK